VGTLLQNPEARVTSEVLVQICAQTSKIAAYDRFASARNSSQLLLRRSHVIA